jgi:hypothetical protein
MRFLIARSSEGEVSKQPPCRGAVRGEPSPAWPGEYRWYVELNSLDELLALLNETGGALGLFAPEEGEDCPAIEVYDEDDGDDGE